MEESRSACLYCCCSFCCAALLHFPIEHNGSILTQLVQTSAVVKCHENLYELLLDKKKSNETVLTFLVVNALTAN